MTFPAGACRFCACTESAPCPGGCAWSDRTRSLCTTCRGAELLAEMVVRVCSDAGGLAAPQIKLTTTAWRDLSFAQQQLLVLAVTAALERQALVQLEDLDERADAALVQLQAITDFLYEKATHEIRIGETVSAMVTRLLTTALEVSR